jgi:hypothetical protein
MAVWRHRVAMDADGALHFVFARYDDVDEYYRCGMSGILNTGNTVEEMRRLAAALDAACDEPVIPMEPHGQEPSDVDEDEDDAA